MFPCGADTHFEPRLHPVAPSFRGTRPAPPKRRPSNFKNLASPSLPPRPSLAHSFRNPVALMRALTSPPAVTMTAKNSKAPPRLRCSTKWICSCISSSSPHCAHKSPRSNGIPLRRTKPVTSPRIFLVHRIVFLRTVRNDRAVSYFSVNNTDQPFQLIDSRIVLNPRKWVLPACDLTATLPTVVYSGSLR